LWDPSFLLLVPESTGFALQGRVNDVVPGVVAGEVGACAVTAAAKESNAGKRKKNISAAYCVANRCLFVDPSAAGSGAVIGRHGFRSSQLTGDSS
jgi:hypothetical protein